MTDSRVGKRSNSAEWKLRQRLEFIEFRLFWYGRVNRSDLREQFHVSPPQASNDIGRYQSLAPDNLEYDNGAKCYIRGSDFAPSIIRNSIDRYLRQIVGVEQHWLDKSDTWFADLPPVTVAAIRRPPLDPDVVMRIYDAIRDRLEIEMEYASISGSSAKTRVIAPHAIGCAGDRWYVRAWAKEHNDFRDYAFARISAVNGGIRSTIDPGKDLEWNHWFDLNIVPNPELEESQQNAKRFEFGMTEDFLNVPCRLSMAFYFIAEHRLDIERGLLSPSQQPLILTNKEEVLEACRVTRKLSADALRRDEINLGQ